MWAVVLAMMVCRTWSSPVPAFSVRVAQVRAAWAEQPSQDKWWVQSQRLIQTNLREIDAAMDIGKYVQEVKDFGANRLHKEGIRMIGRFDFSKIDATAKSPKTAN